MNMTAVMTTPGQPVTEDRAQALERLYAAHATQIYNFAYGKVGNREDAEDITSQVFLKAAAWLDPAQPEPQRLAWLYQVARNTINDHWRRFYSDGPISLDALSVGGGFDLPAEPLHPDTLDDDQGSRDATAQVASILAWLPRRYKVVLSLRFLEGLSLQETAEVLGISLGNTRVLQYRALRKAAMIKSALCL